MEAQKLNLTIKKEWYDAAETMKDPAQRAAFYEAITQYFFTGKEPDADNPALVIFNLIKEDIDRDKTAKAKRAERHIKKAQKKRPIDDQPTTAQQPFNDQAKTTPKATRFVKPTVEQIREYCAEKKYANVDAEKFINHYESNGWRVGSSTMKNWKAAVTNWAHNDYNKGGTAKKTGALWGNENKVPDSIADLL